MCLYWQRLYGACVQAAHWGIANLQFTTPNTRNSHASISKAVLHLTAYSDLWLVDMSAKSLQEKGCDVLILMCLMGR
jgi:hypothetical protein